MGREMGGRFKREGTYVYLWLIHVDVWQKPTQYCKAIILQLPRCFNGKECTCNAGDLGLIPGSGRSSGGRMVMQYSILAWRIPWTEEPGGLQSMESHRVGHN